MLQFILSTILMLSFGTMLYLVARSLPRIGEEPQMKRGMLDRWVASELPEKVDAAFNIFLLKSLRKFKVVLLKADNVLTKHLKKIGPNGNGKPKIDFKDIAGSSEPADSGDAAGVEKGSESGDNQSL